MIWEASDPYLYLRTTPDGRIICGGEDEDFSDEAARDRLLPRKVGTLSRKLRSLLPEVYPEVDYGWTG
jgi:glycine/D-amino acid oxidase-like deaminating enzyme